MPTSITTDVDKRLLQKTKFPPEFNHKVDMTKINVPVIKKWVSDELVRILNSDDDVVTDTIFNIVEGARYPDIKNLQITLTGFLDKDAPKFCEDLWKLCLSAQASPSGIAKEMLEAKKLELIQERIEEERVRKRQEADRERELELARTRGRERGERRGSGGRYNVRRPSSRDSRSPPPRRRDGDDSYRGSRRVDTYIPNSRLARRRDDDRPPRRSRSPSRSRSRSPTPRRSRSPPPRRRRDLSKGRSRSRDRGNDRRSDRRGDTDRRYRPSDIRRRSRSPRRHDRRRSRSDSRRPPYRSRSPPRNKRAPLASDDLMARPGNARREPRLSNSTSSNSETPEVGDDS